MVFDFSTTPSTGLRWECTLNTFMKTLILESFALAVWIEGFVDDHNTAIGRAQYGLGMLQDVARRVAEKLQYEQRDNPQGSRPTAAQPTGQYGECHDAGQKRPAFAGNDGVG